MKRFCYEFNANVVKCKGAMTKYVLTLNTELNTLIMSICFNSLCSQFTHTYITFKNFRMLRVQNQITCYLHSQLIS